MLIIVLVTEFLNALLHDCGRIGDRASVRSNVFISVWRSDEYDKYGLRLLFSSPLASIVQTVLYAGIVVKVTWVPVALYSAVKTILLV